MVQIIHTTGEIHPQYQTTLGTSMQQSSSGLKFFIEQLPVAVAIFDDEMRFLAVSQPFLSDLTQLTSDEALAPAEAIGHSLYEVSPHFPSQLREDNARVLAGETLTQREEQIRRQDGHIDWIQWLAKPWRTPDNRIGGAMVFVEIITEQIEAKHACEKSEQRFRATFENAAVGIAHIAPDLQWIRVNHALSRIIGWPADDIVTMSLRDVCHPDDIAEDLRLTELIRQGKIDSYVMDKRYLRKDGSITWGRVTVSCVRKSDGALDYFVRVIEDISERKRAEERIHLLMRESRHRTKNILGLVQAIARQTAAGNAPDFVGRFTERIQALAANQDLLVRHEWKRIDVKDLVQVQLGHFADLIGTRINFDGPKLHLNAAAAQAIGLALHELATNAGKYGALSTDAGCVDVSWQLDDDTLMMSWIERNGPPVPPPERRGFGSTVIESMVKQALGGEVQLDYAPSGLEWRLTCHAADALEGEAWSQVGRT